MKDLIGSFLLIGGWIIILWALYFCLGSLVLFAPYTLIQSLFILAIGIGCLKCSKKLSSKKNI
ncbi:hypothetical protein ACFQ9Y_25480 [Peribacillus simplex]|uniref:hypothetical protein n=1 Tax=Peribacillus simplex TaxID=1478 RepID=UPI003672C9AC